MKLTDLLSVEEWEEQEREIYGLFGLNSCVFDSEGNRITVNKTWCNELCPAIKGNPDSARAVCAVAHQNIAAQARDEKRPVIGECDAGLVKICAPIFVDQQFLGVFSCCGLRLEDSEVEVFLLDKASSLGEEKIDNLAKSIGGLTGERAHELCGLLAKRLEKIVQDRSVR